MLIRPEHLVPDEAPQDRVFPAGQSWLSDRWAWVVAGMDRDPQHDAVLPSMVSGVVGPAFSQAPDFSHFPETQVITPVFTDYEREKRRRRRQVESEMPTGTTRTEGDPGEVKRPSAGHTEETPGNDPKVPQGTEAVNEGPQKSGMQPGAGGTTSPSHSSYGSP